jgi:hypothetical protein
MSNFKPSKSRSIRAASRSGRSTLVLFAACSLFAPSALAGEKSNSSKSAAKSAAPAAPTQPSLSESLKGEAKDDYESAKVLFEAGDFAGAGIKFQRAYDTSHDPRLLWNLAAVEKSLRHYARVEVLIEQYLKEGGTSVADADRAQANDVLDTVRGLIADVTVTADQAGAVVSVDGVDVGTTPLAPLRLDLGARRIRVQKDGYKSFETIETITGPGSVSVAAKLEPVVHQGQLRVVAPTDAAIRLDGKLVGTGTWEAAVPSGAHTLVVTAPGKHRYASDLVVTDDQTNSVHVELESESVPVVTQPAPNRTWLWISGGIVAAAGIGVGAYFLARPETKGPPSPTQGTLGTLELPLRR